MNTERSSGRAGLPGWVELISGALGASVIVLSDRYSVLHADANACRMLGVAGPDEVLSGWHEVMPELPPARIGALLAAANPCRLQILRGGGSGSRHISLEIHAPREVDGGIILLRDQGDFAGTNMGMAMQLRNQRQVIAGLLHELNGPLNAIRLTLELLSRTLAAESDDGASPGRARDFVEVLREESTRLAQAAQRLPQFLDVGPGMRKDADLREMVTDVMRLLGHHQRMRRIRWTLEMPDGPVVLHGNHKQLREALVCLASYAMDGMPPGSEFSTAMKVDDEHVEMVFRDTGPAITPAGLRELGLLYQPPNPTVPDLHGVRWIIEANHGEFTVANEAELGRRFTLRLPLHA